MRVLHRYRQLRSRTREAGGVLLGRLIVDSDDVVVDLAGAPARQDFRSRFSFFRKARPAQATVDEEWAASSGAVNYLGDWHTHPEDHPVPSQTDLRNWQAIVSSAAFEQDFLLFLIVGRVSLRLWELARPRMLTLELQALVTATDE